MVALRLLGRLELAADGEPVALPASRRARALLAWLALHPGPRTRAEAASALWPDVLDATARTSLRGALAELRRSGAGPVVVAGREDLRLREDVEVDVRRVAELTAAGRWEEALGLDAGPLLPGPPLVPGAEEWLEPHRDEHRARLLEALAGAARAAEERGRLDDALARARRRARLDPLSEDAGREVVRLLDAAGDHAAALAEARGLAERLRRELGVGPGETTRRLVARVRAATVPSPRPAAADPAVPLPPPVAAADPSRLVGRDGALDRLVGDALAPGPAPRVLLVAGEAGVGKTSVVLAAAARLGAAGSLVLHGRCDEEGILPFGAWVEALRHLVAHLDDEHAARLARDAGPELARLLPDLRRRDPALAAPDRAEPDTERWRLFEAVAGLLAELAADRPVVLVLDDAHWADRSTLLLLRHLLRTRRGARVSVLATCREDEVGPATPLRALLGDLRRDGLLHETHLRGLGEDDVRRLVERRRGPGADPALVRALHHETEGNPFFVEEVLRGMPRAAPGARIDVPPGVQDVVRRRLARLPAPARDALVLASVVGREADLPLLEALHEGEGDLLDALDAAVAADLVVEVDVGRWSFAHALVRSAVYEGLSRTRRARLHLRVARALERVAPDGSRVAEVAHHHLEAQDPRHLGAALDAALAAHRRAVAQLAYEEAAAVAERAVAVLGALAPDHPRLLPLLLAAGDARSRAGDSAAARDAFDRAVRVAGERDDPAAAAAAALGFAGPSWQSFGRVDDAAVLRLDAALARLPRGERALRARVQARLAVALYFARVPERVRALTRDAEATARDLGDPAVLAAALEARLWADWHPDGVPGRLATAAELLALATSHGDPELAVLARRWRVVALLEDGRFDEAAAEEAEHARAAGALRLPYEQMYAAVFATMRALLAGRLEEAVRGSARVAAFGELRGGADALQFGGVHALTFAQLQGDLGPAADALTRFARGYPALPAWSAGLAAALAHAGREDEARAEVERVWPPEERLPFDAVWLPGTAFLALAVARLGDVGRARHLHALLLPYAGRPVVLGAGGAVWATTSSYLGLLASVSGDQRLAARHLDEEVALLRAAGAAPWLDLAARARLAVG
ncbi:ATP-binding protein [Vallicoccus soli]|uniref:ATP-binding protein n=1 Tax=Vallicoccus soli TaxID=2339232 RepID=UPI0014026EE9|nr:AAA family ATPase [Vallicoccus soli]